MKTPKIVAAAAGLLIHAAARVSAQTAKAGGTFSIVEAHGYAPATSTSEAPASCSWLLTIFDGLISQFALGRLPAHPCRA
jgi:hypothetical protein